MANFKITGLGAGSALTDSVTLRQAQYGFGSFLTSVAGTNTVTATATPTPAYTVGQRFTFVPAVTNTGATTLNISSVGAGAVQLAGAALTGGELVAAVPVTVYVTATTPVFEIIAPTQFPDSRALVVGATDSTKKIRFEADGITAGATRVLTAPDQDSRVGIVLVAEQASTSGTAINFTGIPAGVKRVTVMLDGVSTNSTTNWIIQIGPSGGLETSAYSSNSDSNGTVDAETSGFQINNFASAAVTLSGAITLSLQDSANNTWVAGGNLSRGDAAGIVSMAGIKSLAGALSLLTVTTIASADTFDAGAISISYE